MLTAARSRKVLLFLPPYAGKVLGPPLGLLSLAGSLHEAGYQPVIVDGALDRDYMQKISNAASGRADHLRRLAPESVDGGNAARGFRRRCGASSGRADPGRNT